ncbi:autotransporter outer membrane beta-barrel domain-containing protein [Alphaproteobacteria bacterium]|nr:autotransporter outer membrane beta-barrel domain-containing protein [Alphaproteobacteria bacterium]
MKLIRIISVALVAVFTMVTVNMSGANAAGTYKISCNNAAYGSSLGGIYLNVGYVYNDSNFGTTGDRGAATGVNGSDQYIMKLDGAYVGNDCLYAGSADTNGTAVVAGDVARMAVNAIVGAVNNRIEMAYAAQNSSASATGLSFSTQSDGMSMSANKIIGGLSFWGDFGTSDFENSQTFTNVRLDSMNFDGDASSYSMGVDKAFGKALIGVVVSNLSTDLKTTFNDGTYKQDVDTYGVYLSYRTSMLHIDLGTGTGDSDITTTRRDLGNDSVINGKTTADINYSHARIAANFSRGRFTLMPSVSYRSMSMDIKAFIDDRADEAAVITGNGEIFTAGNATTAVNDDNIALRAVDTETMSIGMKLSANLGKVVPFLDVSYDSEDTTKATYKKEAGTDGNDRELAGTNYSSSMKIGAGVNFMLGSHIQGGVRAGSINGRDDWEENYVSGNISLGF